MDRSEVSIPSPGHARLTASLMMPVEPTGIIVSGRAGDSERPSEQAVEMARQLVGLGFAVVLTDLTAQRESVRHLTLGAAGAGARLVDALRWAKARPELHELPAGLLGVGPEGASALWAAAELTHAVRAVVARGGRPDHVGRVLGEVTAPTLLIVGGHDWNALEPNDEATLALGGLSELAIVPGADPLFDEPGCLREAEELTGRWFLRHLGSRIETPLSRVT